MSSRVLDSSRISSSRWTTWAAFNAVQAQWSGLSEIPTPRRLQVDALGGALEPGRVPRLGDTRLRAQSGFLVGSSAERPHDADGH